MTTWAVALTSAMLFTILLVKLRLGSVARDVFRISGVAMAIVGDKTKDDLEKEHAMRALSLQMLGYFCHVILRGAAALALPLSLIMVLDRFTPMAAKDIGRLICSGPFILATTLMMGSGAAALHFLGRKS